ncbi:DUF3466 family protein [Nitrosomonas sp.]|uniref:DUF3466 family protein n=1 Tax=Nitrosomonas sp. TaxID=42353 RepID=UPI0025E73A3C|nr:DUF3466 family protein [Nitrosomonas sp.]
MLNNTFAVPRRSLSKMRFQKRKIMNNKLSKIKRTAVFLAGIAAASIPTMALADWSIRALGTLGGTISEAYDINNSGQVVGSYGTIGNYRAFITGPNGAGMSDLGTLGGKNSIATGINDSGQVVGSSSLGYFRTHAFITGPNGGGMNDLGFLSVHPGENNDFEYSEAFAINNSGQVAGTDGGEPYITAFITGTNGIGLNGFTRFDQWNYSSASGINDSGQVTGYLMNGTENLTRPFITGPNGTGITVLENLGGSYSNANSINNAGQVVGGSYLAGDTVYHAFITGPNGVGTTDLLDGQGGAFSYATDINDSGQVVGYLSTTDGGNSFLFSNNEMTDLSLLPAVIGAGWTNVVAQAINNNGQIVGYGKFHGHTEAFLLSPFPVPEPQTYAMLLAGLGLMGFMAHRRKVSAA